MDAIDRVIANTPAYAGKTFQRVPYNYVLPFASLAAGAVANGQLQFQADADFIIQAQSYYAFTANAPTAATRPYPNVTILQNDSGAGKNLSNVAMPIPTEFGDGQFPFILPTPYIWSRNSVMSCQLTNNDGATAYTMTLVFIGVKLQELTR